MNDKKKENKITTEKFFQQGLLQPSGVFSFFGAQKNKDKINTNEKEIDKINETKKYRGLSRFTSIRPITDSKGTLNPRAHILCIGQLFNANIDLYDSMML